MSDPTVISNGHSRPILYFYDLTPEQQAQVRDDMPYLFENDTRVTFDEAEFILYAGEIYDLSEFQRTGFPNSPAWLRKWDAYSPDSFFSGILMRYARDCGALDTEHVVMGQYF